MTVYVVNSSPFISFSREWKQVETRILLEMTWLFFRLGEEKWQHCPTRWILVTSSSNSGVLDTENLRRIYSKKSAWLSHSSICVAWNTSKFTINWVRQAIMALWKWKIYVRWDDSWKKAERRVQTNRRGLGHALGDLKTWMHEWNKWLWKTAAWLWKRYLPMPTYSLDLWTPSCMTTWNSGKFLQDSFRECWPIKKDFTRRSVSGNVITWQGYE